LNFIVPHFNGFYLAHFLQSGGIELKTKKSIRSTELVLASCLLSAGFAPAALAQAVSDANADISEVVVTGTRRSGMAVSDSPAPV